ncbi:filamentous hemagglutinin family outer membrane protein [[Leptolyngbya] sp. PCC 7376]|uniref:two-partner secretion domain-containing protein n=1 Tax=[Leptolyngbya] sp. PCC 7376 TaxID=111781 RepID=UPI00029F1C78|nr:filamentous hemagglutinin N-terminal domain-containing protein [[Leptolyngbya] sp. PCC 7376]AFY38531.1 filamentous hemagglutinin family outer membrane protein [[Leptolyngbya] sp. PCC 7376]
MTHQFSHTTKSLFHWNALVVGAASTIMFGASSSQAQLLPDTSLGIESSTISAGDVIHGGATRGSNLFHSFSDFNVNAGQAVYFANPTGIENILSRITGRNVSNIDGLLGVDGTANLFLLNPNGIIFGENARLDISGSFTASTGNSFTFTDGSEFSATPTAGELLTMNVPLGVQFNDRPQGNLTNEANLTVGNGSTLTLFGRDVVNSGNLTALGGTVEILGDRVALTDQANIDVSSPIGNGQVFIGGNYQGIGSLPNAISTFVGNDVVINANALTDGDGGQVIVWADEDTRFLGKINSKGGVISGNGGLVEVSGKQQLDFRGDVDTSAVAGSSGTLLLDPENITIVDGNSLPANVADGLWDFSEDPGDQTIGAGAIATLLLSNALTLQAIDTITVDSAVNTGSSNSLTLEASNIILNEVITSPLGGDVNLITPQSDSNRVLINSSSGINNDVSTNVNGGDIQITTHDLTIQNGGILFAGTVADGGDSGRITINASGNVLVTEGAVIDSRVLSGVGRSRGIEIVANTFTAENSSMITTSSSGNGDAGNITFRVAELNLLNNAAISASTTGGGKGGVIRIEFSEQLFVDGGKITASTENVADGGSIEIIGIEPTGSGTNNDKIVTITNDGMLSASSTSDGAAGNITFQVAELNLLNNGLIEASTTGRGKGGVIRIEFSQKLLIDSGRITTSANGVGEAGEGGSILILEIEPEPTKSGISNDRTVTITNGGVLSVFTAGSGDGGDIDIQVSELNITGGGITAATGGSGESGSIGIQASKLNITSGGIGLSTDGTGDGGLLEIIVSELNLADSSRIEASTTGPGDGGDIEIQTSTLNITDSSRIEASTSGSGEGGIIRIFVFDVINVSNNGFIAAGTSSSGGGGDIEILTPELNLTNAGRLAASTSGSGQGGIIDIFSPKVSLTNGSTITASTNGPGKGGNIDLIITELNFLNGGEITASTSGSGDGGDLILEGNSPLTLRGNGRFSVASSTPTSGRAGNLTVNNASILALRDGVTLSAESASEQGGGNVNITVDNHVFLTGGSLINASSSNTNAGNGGNVTLTLGNGFLIARPDQNNDIIANAVGGNGGNININALRIFGLTEQGNSNFNVLRGNLTNDISASSEFGFNGTISLNTLDLDPSQGLTELPAVLSDRTDQIAASCDIGNTENQGKFVVTGRGGLPLSSSTLGNAAGLPVPWVTAPDDEPVDIVDLDSSSTFPTLVEAQSVARDKTGNMHFVADPEIFASSKLQAASSDFCQTTYQL